MLNIYLWVFESYIGCLFSAGAVVEVAMGAVEITTEMEVVLIEIITVETARVHTELVDLSIYVLEFVVGGVFCFFDSQICSITLEIKR